MKIEKMIAAMTLCMMLSTAQAATDAQPVKATYVTSDYAKTQYPLVFSHGMAGFDRLGTGQFGIDYWYQILPNLARNGASVWATQVSPFNSSEVRGEQLLQQVEEILAITGAEKVNLIGHSHGGPTIRYVAGIMPNQISSLTTVGAPHQGSPVADVILKAEHGALEKPLVAAMTLLSKTLQWAQGLNPNRLPHDALASGHSLSRLGAQQFNQKFPLGLPQTACAEGAAVEQGIHMYSFTGTATLTNPLDPDSALLATSLLINKGRDNDGLVARCSAKFGKTIRDNYHWNHLDEVNQMLGLKSWFAPDPVDIYRQHANRLKMQNL